MWGANVRIFSLYLISLFFSFCSNPNKDFGNKQNWSSTENIRKTVEAKASFLVERYLSHMEE
jgi:hypothetical protein